MWRRSKKFIQVRNSFKKIVFNLQTTNMIIQSFWLKYAIYLAIYIIFLAYHYGEEYVEINIRQKVHHAQWPLLHEQIQKKL